MSKRTRAFRRHHRQRMINRAYRKASQWQWEDPKWMEVYALKNHNNMAVCSCPMCCNPRHNPWLPRKESLTMQEQREYNSLCDGVEEYFSPDIDQPIIGENYVQSFEGEEAQSEVRKDSRYCKEATGDIPN